MADIELVIKISEEIYANCKKECERKNALVIDYYTYALGNGTPLPKNHGRLIDADELKKEYPHDTDWDYPVNTHSCVVESIDNSPTIIEAKSEE